MLEGEGLGGLRCLAGNGFGQEGGNGVLCGLFVNASFLEAAPVEDDVGQIGAGQDVLHLLVTREALVELGIELLIDRLHIQPCGVNAKLGGFGGNGRDAVIGAEGEPDVSEAVREQR